MSSINTPLLYSTYSREPRPELDERRAQPPRLELGHAPHELLEVRLRDVVEVVEVARHHTAARQMAYITSLIALWTSCQVAWALRGV